MEAAQLQTTSDIADLEQIAEQTSIRGNARKRGGRGWHGGIFGWSASPNIERSSVAREKVFVAKESPEPEEPTPVIHIFTGANVTSYTELIGGIRQKLAALGIRYLDFDVLAGFAPGLSGKVFGPSQAKRLGPEKLFDALRAAGLRIRIEEDPEQTAKMAQRISERFNPRQANQARMENGNHFRPSEQLIRRVLKHLANNNRGGLPRLNGAVKEARSNWARHAHQIRYGKGLTPCS
jgi:hypothetical protein